MRALPGCRREILDRTLIWNENHLRRILYQYETHHNQHRPHRSLNSAAPLKPLPEPVDLEQHHVRRHPRVGGMITNTAWSHDVDEILGTHTIQNLPNVLVTRTFIIIPPPYAEG